jgi:acylaminoacyl-peptidase
VAVSLAGKIQGNPGQVAFSADGKRLLFTNAKPEVERLGVIYCTNRNTSIQFCDLTGENVGTIAENMGSARGLRSSPSGDKMFFISNDLHGPHNSGSRLHEFSWETKKLRVVVDTVKKPKPGQFPGLYLLSLPARCWISETQLLCSSIWRSSTAVLLIDTASGDVVDITPAESVVSKGLWTVFDVTNSAILLNHTAPNKPNNLVLCTVNHKRKRGTKEGDLSSDSFVWRSLTLDGQPLLADLPRYSEITQVKYRIINFEENPDLEAILMESPGRAGLAPGSPSPLIVIPHGGPHGSFVPEFFVSQMTYLLSGYSCLLVNYRGSTGFGEDALRSLPGNIGTQEVGEVHFAAQKVVKEHHFDPKRIFLHGGSHGGFTVGNLIGQYPVNFVCLFACLLVCLFVLFSSLLIFFSR